MKKAAFYAPRAAGGRAAAGLAAGLAAGAAINLSLVLEEAGA